MLKKSILILFLLFSCVMQAQPTLSLDWMKLVPEGYAIKVKKDSKGNAIVLAQGDGNPYSHIITLKYSKIGALLWKKIYVDPLNSFPDLAEDLEVDSLDNIYVSGTVNYDVNGVFLNSRTILIKYDSLGYLLWKREYGSNINPLIEGSASSIKVYKNKYISMSGSIDSVNGNGFQRSLVIQYDSSGILNWVHIDSSNYRTFSTQIVIDKEGGSYACGVTACCPPALNMQVTKFDLAGNLKWETVIDEVDHAYSYALYALIDDSANVFLGGETIGQTTSTGIDCYVAKIDSSGNQIWTNTLFKDSGNIITESTTNIVLDAYQDIYVSGYSLNTSNPFHFLQKINNHTGHTAWVHWSNALGYGKGYLAEDSLVFFTGQDSLSNLIIHGIDTSGTVKIAYKTFCQCFANDLFVVDSSFFLAGENYQPFSTNEDSIMICRINIDATTGLTSHSIISNISVFPNPFIDKLYLSLSKNVNSILKMEVHNLIGNKVYSNSDIRNSTIINTESWQAGIFILTIETENGIYRRKLIKAK